MFEFLRNKNTDKNKDKSGNESTPAQENTPKEDTRRTSEQQAAINSDTNQSSATEQHDNASDVVLSNSVTDKATIKPESEDTEAGFFKRFAKKLSKTSSSLGDGLGKILLGAKEIDDELIEDIETQLLVADIGVETTSRIMNALSNAVERDALTNSDALFKKLKAELKLSLQDKAEPLTINSENGPFVILVVGVNGAGKTTTIGKLAKQLQLSKKNVMLAAGDTFRAAAVEQLQVWGGRNNVPVVAQGSGADSASVIYDALESAKARNIDVLIADTAGRLHNKEHLLEELKKIVRVMKKIDAKAPHEVLLVLDATAGQNAIAQAKTFKEAVGVSGIAVSKLDGTAKGGVLFAIKDQLGLPVRFIGVGEKVEDLRPFEPDEFVDAIFADQN